MGRFAGEANERIVYGVPCSNARIVHSFNRRRLGANGLVICASTSDIFRVTTRRSVIPARMLCRCYGATHRVLRNRRTINHMVTEPFGNICPFGHAPQQRSCSLLPPGGAIPGILGSGNCSIVSINGVFSVFTNRNFARDGPAIDGGSNVDGALRVVSHSFGKLYFVGLISFSVICNRHGSVSNCTETVASFSGGLGAILRGVYSNSLLVVATSRNYSPGAPSASRSHRCAPVLTCFGNMGPVGLNAHSDFTSVNGAILR